MHFPNLYPKNKPQATSWQTIKINYMYLNIH